MAVGHFVRCNQTHRVFSVEAFVPIHGRRPQSPGTLRERRWTLLPQMLRALPVKTMLERMSSSAGGSVYRRTLAYYRPFLTATIAGMTLNLAAVGLNLLKPWPFKLIIDDILQPTAGESHGWHGFVRHLASISSPQTAILVLCLGIVAIQVLWGICNLAANFTLIRASLQALLKLRTELYAYLQSLPLKFHDSRRSADSTFRVAYDSQSIQTIYNKGLSGIFGAITGLIGTVVIMMLMDWKLTLISLAILPFVVFTIRLFAVRIREDSTTIQEKESALLTEVQEGLSSVRMVQAFNQQHYEVKQFREVAQRSLFANLKLNVTTLQSALFIGSLMAFGTALLYYVGSNHVLDGSLTLGDLTVFAWYLTMLYQPLEALSYTAWALEGATAGARRCFEVLDKEDDVADAPDAVPFEYRGGDIVLGDIRFGYGPDREILKGLTLEIRPGSTVAIVGGTGAGKSTLLGLIPRFYDPNSGEVTIDGQAVKSVTKSSLREKIGVVLQDTLLFSTSVRENIAYGRPDASLEDIIAAAKAAEAHDFIQEMRSGYDSEVGERGSHLSVGQRQRIGIARAFLKNAPLLLLDEPTSALDPKTESAIMKTLRRLMAGRTTLIVTHRIATVHELNEIIVLKDGLVAEAGRGPDLLEKGGLYAELYRAMDEH
jgi:ATP-binding cassette subfamily B protein/subfamily B ATP-binding cassette protein MsbA